MTAFETEITETVEALVGPWRKPRQMLQAQTYDAHASIHDDATAQKLGFKGGTIEGPTHFSQFAPLGAHLWGQDWFESGCLSAHYRSVCYEGEEVQAILSKPLPGTRQCQIQMVKRDGTEVLCGTASVGEPHAATALETRLGELKPLADPVILRDVKVAQTGGGRRCGWRSTRTWETSIRSPSGRSSRSSPRIRRTMRAATIRGKRPSSRWRC